MRFEPIAVVGMGCVLPGASDPASLWRAISNGQDLVSSAPPGRWRVEPETILGTGGDRTWSDRGGYVRDFEFDPNGFELPAAELRGIDPLNHWLLESARQATQGVALDRARCGVIAGNLSFPSSGLSAFAERHWLGDELADRVGIPAADARDRFMSGLPVHTVAQALGLGGPAFALDAACASALYAIKLACDRLHDRHADWMLAGAVNRADDLFIHVGFCALQAMSKSGQSRPFHAGADGLVPAEGAGLVLLRRLSDAERDGSTILGVIRGVGLSNDGRGRGLLVPNSGGQARAMQSALDQAGWQPDDVDVIECHATGTQVGDGTELASMRAVYGDRAVPLGSLKSNLGHLITAAGVAGLIKVLSAMQHETLPPTLHAHDAEHPELGAFDLLHQARPWTGDKRAAVSAFGFGGNNAHLLVEQHRPNTPCKRVRAQGPLAIVGLGTVVGDTQGVPALQAALQSGRGGRRLGQVTLPLKGLRFPPNDLKQTLPQQLAMLQAALEAARGLDLPARTGVMVGMGCDPSVARYGARWRAPDWSDALGQDEAWTQQLQSTLMPLLESAGVLGTMPNIPANRINSQLDLGGFSLTVSSEELSGLRALEVAQRALRTGQLDAVLVGAVDMASGPEHADAAARVGQDGPGGDAAVALVVMRLEDAQSQGATIYAVLDDADAPPFPAEPLHGLFGYPHAATGLLRVAGAVLALCEGQAGGFTVSCDALGGQRAQVVVLSTGPHALDSTAPDGPVLHFPGQLPEVVVPPVSSVVAPGAQRMAPAPTLPRTTDTAVVAPVMQALPASAPLSSAPVAPTPVPVAAAPVLTAPPVVPATGPMAVLQATQARLAEIHRAFLQQQAQAHEAFLAHRQASIQVLLQSTSSPTPVLARTAAAQAPVARPVPAAPVAPVTPVVPVAKAPTPVAKTPAPVAIPKAAPPTPAPKAAPAAPVGFSDAAHPWRTDPMGEPPAFREPDTDLPGLRLSREQLQVHASGAISEVYGEQFQPQDPYVRQCRMPEPPLLLADRVVGLDAEPGSMGRGTIWTETDVDGWYLHQGRMPAGILIESGQADLMLISYLGIDLEHPGDRIYRLLGCELTYHGHLPAQGDTLRYDIHVDGHAKHGNVRLFFFHYDCRVDGHAQLTVRQGQAGFFTDEELLESGGVLWTPEEQEIVASPRMDAPEVLTPKRSLTRAELEAFSQGDVVACFGPEFYLSNAHTRTPTIQGGRMLFLDTVPELLPNGGPWGRGYLRAEAPISPDDWFFDGHFKNDPCMPGTLMFEGCLQAMAVYLAALGFTVDRDGWRFEPVPGVPYQLQCRGQVTPTSKRLTYELFVEEIQGGPEPILWADLLCTVDGLKAFHCRRMGLRLVPDWPLVARPGLAQEHIERGLVKDGTVASLEWTGAPIKQLSTPTPPFAFDYASLLACAWDTPSRAFGPMYETFDSPRRVARLPGPPYHFMSRVSRIDGTLGGMKVGDTISLEYDIPPQAWYFHENGAPTMPFAVLLEAALQPCGWLASFAGSALTVDRDLFFRNLDGTGTLRAELLPGSGTLRTDVELTNISNSAGMIIESFKVACFLDDVLVYDLTTVFGFFPAEALAAQKGLPISDAQQELLDRPSERAVELRTNPAKYCGETPRLARPYLRMVDRVTGIWPTGGAKGLGEYRGEKDVRSNEWFFRAHFFQDPVQPGSLGLEALVQLLQFAMIDQGMSDGVDNARFEPMELGRPMTWKYRGQVRTFNTLIGSTIEITEVGTDAEGHPYAVANGSLWVDGMRIYETKNMGMRVVPSASVLSVDGRISCDNTPPVRAITLDPNGADAWLHDHCPTFTVPAAPMMWVVDQLAKVGYDAGEGRQVVGVDEVQIRRWITAPEVQHLTATVLHHDNAITVRLHQDDALVASGKVQLSQEFVHGPHGLRPLTGRIEQPYERLFHGPTFQLVEQLTMGETGSSSVVQVTRAIDSHWDVALLDAATHGIPHDELERWSDEIAPGQVAYPATIPTLRVHGPAPKVGEHVRVEVRFDGFHGTKTLPRFQVQIIQEGGFTWCSFTLVEALFPKGRLGSVSPADRAAFLRDRAFVPGVSLSQDGVLQSADVAGSDWLPGTMAAVYGTDDPAQIGVREALAAEIGVHPGAALDALPLNPVTVDQTAIEGGFNTSVQVGPVDLSGVQEFWSGWFDRDPWPVEDLYYGLLQRFVRRVVTPDPAAIAAIQGRSVLYLANHQTGVESLLFSILASGLGQVPTVTLAKAEHRHTWLGKLIAHNFSYPGVRDPEVIRFFDRQDKASLPAIIGELARDMAGPGKSVMVHVEGTRSFSCRTPVQKMSGAFIDMALKIGAPVVPVRFVGGLPVEPLAARVEFPVGQGGAADAPFAMGQGQQDIWFGKPLLPQDLAGVPYGERKQRVVAAINSLGPDNAMEQPVVGDAAFEQRVQSWMAERGVSHEHATLAQVLLERPSVCAETQRMLDGEPCEGWLGELSKRLMG